MNYKNTLKFAYSQIQEVEKLLERITGSDNIEQIELDLILSKLRELYDVILLIKDSDKSVIHKEPVSKKEHEEVEEPAETKEKSSDKDVDDNKNVEFEVSMPKEEQEKPKEVLSDKFKNKRTSINDDIGLTYTKKDLSSKLKSKPVDDISKAIGLNEKFAFINKLFEGNTEKYNQTIEVLNNASDFNEAYNFILEKFNWNMNNELVQQILDLIRRKFIVSNE